MAFILGILACDRHARIEVHPAASSLAAPDAKLESRKEEHETDAPNFRMPKGVLAKLSCADAKKIVAQVKAELPYTPRTPAPAEIGRQMAMWMDGFGLFVDPVLAKAFAKAGESVSSLGSENAGCGWALTLGEKLKAFVDSLRLRLDEGQRYVGPGGTSRTAATVLHFAPVQTADQHALQLGKDLADMQKNHPELQRYGDVLRTRVVPSMAADDWAMASIAAAVRSWVSLVDAHSSWAPLEEESSLYDIDLDDITQGALFRSAEPTMVGAVIVDNPLAPLQKGDVILRVRDQVIAGLTGEELDELAVAALADQKSCSMTLLRQGQVVSLDVAVSPKGKEPTQVLRLDRIPYGNQSIGVIRIPDVHDSLGAQIATIIREAKRDTNLIGLVLDVRGNGGGSMEGALDALAHFLPNLPMCPLKSKRGLSDPDVTGEPPEDERWGGPLIVFVDRDTASAAEILAGSLQSYGRATVVGTPTFGKGCVQEYLDDEPRVGVLRITTYIYALPDGSPVQRVGLRPNISFPFEVKSKQSENATAAAPPTWRGPDVRPTKKAIAVAWPKREGSIGPCQDHTVCDALNALQRRAVARR